MDEIEKLIKKVDKLYEESKFTEAINTCNEILKQQPDNVGVLITLGNLHNNYEEYDKATDVFNKIDSLEVPDDLLENKNNNHSLLLLNLVIYNWKEVEDDEGNPLPGSEKDIEKCRVYLQQTKDLNPSWETLQTEIEKWDKRIKAADDYLTGNPKEERSGVNLQSYALMDEMYNTLSYVDKEGQHWATSIEEADLAEELINKAEKAMKDPSDTELVELIAINRNHVNDARKRRFTGAWWLIVLAGIVVIFSFYTSFDTLGDRISEDVAAQSIESQKAYNKQAIAKYESKAELTDNEEGYLENAKEKLQELNETTAADYASDFKSYHIKSGLKGIFWALVGLGWVVGYYFAARPYGYMQYKRQKEYQVIQKATGWGAAIITGILGIFMSIPITTYITKYSDGSRETSSDAIFVLIIKLVVIVALAALVLYIAFIAIPFATIIAYVRNFPDKIGAKQFHSMFGQSKGFVEKYIDKLKMKTA